MRGSAACDAASGLTWFGISQAGTGSSFRPLRVDCACHSVRLHCNMQVLAVPLAPSVWQEAPYLPRSLRCTSSLPAAWPDAAAHVLRCS